MAEQSRSGWFRKRNILGAVLVAGIMAGVYLGDMWKGFGGGSTLGVGLGDPSSSSTAASPGDSETKKTESSTATKESAEDPNAAAQLEMNVPPVIKIVIDDRAYSIRSANGDKPAEIPRIIELIKAAPGDADGIRVRIYKKLSSRTSAEIALQEAFSAAGISDDHVLWIPTPID
jgi:hypothetical protein